MISFLINGIERKDKVEAYTLDIQKTISKKRNSCSFEVVTHSGDSFLPRLGQEVVITDNGTKIFAGIIINYESKSTGKGILRHNIECQDYIRLLDRRLVPDRFTNQTVNEIITFLKENYFPSDITINNVNCPVNITTASFNYKPISTVLEELAKRTGYEWYIDYDKDLHFFQRESNTAPFEINDDDGSYRVNSLTIRKDNSQIRNAIVVRGGEYDGANFTSEIEANGTDFIFNVGYKFADFRATLTADPLSVGVDYLNDPNDYDALHNYNEKLLRFKQEDTPTAGSILRVSGRPRLPVIVQYRSDQHINAMISAEGGSGIYEYLIKDTNIKSKEEARERARVEIEGYGESLIEGDFTTLTSGLEAGQKIKINSSLFGINEYYIIQSVSIKQHTHDSFIYNVKLISKRTFDLIDILKNLILKDTDNIKIDENEVIDLVRGVDENFTMSESFTVQSLDYETEFCLGTFTGGGIIPLGKKRIFIINGSPLG